VEEGIPVERFSKRLNGFGDFYSWVNFVRYPSSMRGMLEQVEKRRVFLEKGGDTS